MIIERKEFHCQVCNGIRILKKGDREPKVCPFCGMDKFGELHWEKKWVSEAKK